MASLLDLFNDVSNGVYAATGASSRDDTACDGRPGVVTASHTLFGGGGVSRHDLRIQATKLAEQTFDRVALADIAANAPDITVTPQAIEQQQRGVPVSQFGGFRNVVPTQAESRDDNAADHDKTATHQF